MIDLSKSLEFFDPSRVRERVHIVGCGSVGSTIAENLARCGIKNMTLYDFDKVEAHNVHNQMFDQRHVGMNKADALKSILIDINPELVDTVICNENGWTGKQLNGYVFLAVDSIDLRREFVEKHLNNPNIRAVFDVRTMLTGAQHYACSWNNYKAKQNFLKTMQFSHEEAAEETPVSACGVTLGIVTTVRLVCAYCTNNFIKFVKGEGLYKFIQFDGFNIFVDAFEE